MDTPASQTTNIITIAALSLTSGASHLGQRAFKLLYCTVQLLLCLAVTHRGVLAARLAVVVGVVRPVSLETLPVTGTWGMVAEALRCDAVKAQADWEEMNGARGSEYCK